MSWISETMDDRWTTLNCGSQIEVVDCLSTREVQSSMISWQWGWFGGWWVLGWWSGVVSRYGLALELR